ncbi:unnamed protein product [Brugia timori]|uniref:Aa_trans domain-containing protein n=1 Tax=Brugia timori TaxID=42155 RepID=A0A0R3Q469_9BILA|nr:unnamed protein product [Brugia timori]
MWFEERSWSNLKMSSMLVEEWRDLWPIKIDVIVASLAYVFATTNFLNLPGLILQNGGLAFIVAYGASLFVCVLPIIVMEFSVGQLTGRAPIEALHNICPLFKGKYERDPSQQPFTFPISVGECVAVMCV